MPLIYWFSRRMTLWGSISFNLAVFINIIIAFFYPYMEGASTGGDTSLAGSPSLGLGRALGPAGSVGTRGRVGKSTLALLFGLCTLSWGDTDVVLWDRWGP